MYFQHIYDKGLAQGSYLIGCQKEGVAAVIDPKRDVDTYLTLAQENNLQITHILETHIHADFLSGSRELAALTGANMYLSDEGGADWQYAFEHIGLRDGDKIAVGNLVFDVLHTPGHTPESISFLLTDKPAGDIPVMLFTGDFVFVGDIGRPDLLEKAAGIKGTQEPGARQMYRSLHKFSSLPPYIQVWPAHGAGSACGKALGSVPSSTTGYEMLRNWAFRYGNDETGFVQFLLSDQPEPPKYFAMMKKLNKTDRPLLTTVPEVQQLDSAALQNAILKGYPIVDTRSRDAYAQGHIPGSLFIQDNRLFNTWAGWFLDYDTPFVLLADPAKLNDITRKLMRIGLDNIHGYFPSISTWQTTGGKTVEMPVMTMEELDAVQSCNRIQLMDVRGATEFSAGHIPGAQHFFVGTIPGNLNGIDTDKEQILYCQSGDRAAIAYALLERAGFQPTAVYTGGISEWAAAGKPVTA